MNKKLTSLADHNSRARKAFGKSRGNSPIPNGIACPKCGAELLDSTPMMVLASRPAKKNVHCSKCDYVGYRVA